MRADRQTNTLITTLRTPPRGGGANKNLQRRKLAGLFLSSSGFWHILARSADQPQLSSGPDLGEGPGARPQASNHRGASHQTAHVLFLANESADDFS